MFGGKPQEGEHDKTEQFRFMNYDDVTKRPNKDLDVIRPPPPP